MPGRGIEVGLISDTHGLMRPQALEALTGSDFIVHGGDIGDAGILEQLARIAPVTAVRGNNDHGPWAAKVPQTAVLDAGGILIYALHDIGDLDLDPAAAGFSVVVTGHSHKPSQELQGGVLYINPGSAGPRRFTLPIAVARLTIAGKQVTSRLIELAV